MITFDVTVYTKSDIWQNDLFLVQPDAVKICRCCNRKWYSSEFADYPGFLDGKLPVCSRCCRKHDKTHAASLIDESGITVDCRRCEKNWSLSNFVARAGDWTEVTNICYNCRTAHLHEIG